MRVLDLFSGIGGFSLGLERAGMRTVAFCERDEYCRAVLRKHWPQVPCFNDIHALDAERLGGLGRIDVVSGGFPCQPFSVAGKQRAQDDDRHLWPQMRRVIALARPAWVVGENVTGIIPLALDDVLFDLEGLGYATRTFVIPAVAVDARHRRDRVWIVAHSTGGENRGLQLTKLAPNVAGGGEDVADASSKGLALGELHPGIPGNAKPRNAGQDSAVDRDVQHAADDSTNGARVRRDEPARQWRPEPDVGRVAHGVPRRVDRLRALGNAVVPQIPEIIGRAIMRAAK